MSGSINAYVSYINIMDCVKGAEVRVGHQMNDVDIKEDLSFILSVGMARDYKLSEFTLDNIDNLAIKAYNRYIERITAPDWMDPSFKEPSLPTMLGEQLLKALFKVTYTTIKYFNPNLDFPLFRIEIENVMPPDVEWNKAKLTGYHHYQVTLIRRTTFTFNLP